MTAAWADLEARRLQAAKAFDDVLLDNRPIADVAPIADAASALAAREGLTAAITDARICDPFHLKHVARGLAVALRYDLGVAADIEGPPVPP